MKRAVILFLFFLFIGIVVGDWVSGVIGGAVVAFFLGFVWLDAPNTPRTTK